MIKGGKGNNYIYLLSAVHHSVSHFVKQKTPENKNYKYILEKCKAGEHAR
jgi:hypothetical protein